MPYKRGKKWVGKIEHRGEVFYCGTHDTKRDAVAAEVRRREELSAGYVGSRETIGSFGRRWLNDYVAARGVKPGTLDHYAERIGKFLEEHGDVPLAEWDRTRSRRYALEHRDRAKVISTMFEDAYNDGIIPVNHWRYLNLRTQQRERITILTLVEFEEACEHIRFIHGPEYGPRFEAMFRFAGWTGCRPGELFAMGRDSLRPKENLLKVREQTYRDGTRGTPKNGLEREVVLPDQAIEAIERLPRRMDGLLFASSSHKPMTMGILSRDWGMVRGGIAQPSLTWYEATKHFCGSQLALMGVSDRAIGHQLGHTDDGETARRHYIHLRPSDTHEERLQAFARLRQVVPLRGPRRLAEAEEGA